LRKDQEENSELSDNWNVDEKIEKNNQEPYLSDEEQIMADYDEVLNSSGPVQLYDAEQEAIIPREANDGWSFRTWYEKKTTTKKTHHYQQTVVAFLFCFVFKKKKETLLMSLETHKKIKVV
jgi:hypothetical protein